MYTARQTNDTHTVYRIMRAAGFPHLPTWDAARERLKQAHIVGLYKKEALVGAFLLFDGCYVDVVISPLHQRRWARPRLCADILAQLRGAASGESLYFCVTNAAAERMAVRAGAHHAGQENNVKTYVL